MSKKVFLDTNILLDFLDSKRELNNEAKQLVYFLVRNKFKIVFSEDMISTIIYLIKDKEDKKLTISNFEKFTYDTNIDIIPFGVMVIRNACNYFAQNGGDFEDLLQYFCAEKEDCVAIYTNDVKFPKLKVPVKTYGDFDI